MRRGSVAGIAGSARIAVGKTPGTLYCCDAGRCRGHEAQVAGVPVLESYFDWSSHCRFLCGSELLAESYPETKSNLKLGFRPKEMPQ
jgi:hypothetical protein